MKGQQSIEKVKQIFTAYLKIKKLRNTSERYKILEEIYTRNDHYDAEKLYLELIKKGYKVSKATVYNTLILLLDCNLVVAHRFDNKQTLYERAYGYRQHDHLICTDCDKVHEFCDPRLQNIQESIGKLLEFNVIHHSLVLYAQCNAKNCANKIAI